MSGLIWVHTVCKVTCRHRVKLGKLIVDSEGITLSALDKTLKQNI